MQCQGYGKVCGNDAEPGGVLCGECKADVPMGHPEIPPIGAEGAAPICGSLPDCDNPVRVTLEVALQPGRETPAAELALIQCLAALAPLDNEYAGPRVIRALAGLYGDRGGLEV